VAAGDVRNFGRLSGLCRSGGNRGIVRKRLTDAVVLRLAKKKWAPCDAPHGACSFLEEPFLYGVGVGVGEALITGLKLSPELIELPRITKL
jgi:hypothetical protein